jgi:hypothetical protein
MNLQDCQLLYSAVGHGTLGTYGDSGYGIIISVNGISFNNYISAHPHAILRYRIPESSQYFSCQLALNDSSEEFTTADFEFIVDGDIKYFAHNVGKFTVVDVEFLLENNSILEIKIISTNKIVCHSLLLNPSFSNKKPNHILCPIHKSKISTEKYTKEKFNVCIASFIDTKFIKYAEVLQQTIKDKSSINVKFVYLGDSSPEIIDFCQRTNSIFIPISCVYGEDIAEKHVQAIYHKPSTYSIAKIINANIYIIIDVDMVCTSDINLLIERIESNNPESISVCKDAHTEGLTFGDLIINEWSAYKGSVANKHMLRMTPKELSSSLIINSGVIVGKRKAILGVEDTMRRLMPNSIFYLNDKISEPVREQALMNLAMIKYEEVEILHKKYNLQVLWEELNFEYDGTQIKAYSEDFEPCFAHFNGHISKPHLDNFIEKYKTNTPYNIDRIKCGSKISDLLRDRKMIKILDLQNDSGIVMSFIKTTNCKSYKVERITNTEKITINAFEEPFSKPIEDKMLELKQLKHRSHEYDAVIVGNFDNPTNVSILLSKALDLLTENGFIVFNQYIQSEATLEEIKGRNLDFDNLKIINSIEENLNQKIFILKK